MRDIDILSLLPFVLVAITAVAAMLVAAFTRREGPVFGVTATGLLLAFVSMAFVPAQTAPVDTLLTIDGYARFFMGLFLLATLMVVAMITSKGASGVTGAGFVCLAATLAVVPSVPIQSLALLVGIDRLMSQCRSFTNLIGNGVATIVISRWEKEVTPKTLCARLASPTENKTDV